MTPLRRSWLPPYAAAAFCVALLAARAGAQTPAASPGRVSGKEYALKNVSSFNAPPAESRNPFWPIGWVPTAPVPVAVAAAPVADVRADQFTVTSISVDAGGGLAVINGQTRGVGESVSVPASATTPGAAPLFVTVRKITDGEVTLDYKGKLLSVRPGAAAPKKK